MGETTILIGAAYSGNALALRQLMDRVYGRLHQIAARVVGSLRPYTLDSDDATHGAILRLCGHIREVSAGKIAKIPRNGPEFFGYASRVIANFVLDELRSRQRVRSGLDSIPEPAVPAPDPALLAVSEAIESYREQFPKQGEVLRLWLWGDCTDKEIAELTGLPATTVRYYRDSAVNWIVKRLQAA